MKEAGRRMSGNRRNKEEKLPEKVERCVE